MFPRRFPPTQPRVVLVLPRYHTPDSVPNGTASRSVRFRNVERAVTIGTEHEPAPIGAGNRRAPFRAPINDALNGAVAWQADVS